MAIYTLANFQDEIEVSTGSSGLDPVRTTRYVNFAYFEILGAVEFDTLVGVSPFSTVAGQEEYSIPANGSVKAVVNLDVPEDSLLGYRSLVEFYRTNRGTNGIPAIWTRQGDEILISPPPSTVLSMQMILRSDPNAFSAAGDVSVLPPTWDPGISLLATHYAKMSLGHGDAAAFYNRAVQYLATRVADEERTLRASGIGVAISQAMGGG